MAKTHEITRRWLLPESERQPLRKYERLLDELEEYATKFNDAVALFDFCAQQSRQLPLPPMGDAQKTIGYHNESNRFQNWQFCACEWAGIQIYHFGKVIETALAIKGYKNLGVFSSYLDKNALRLPRDLFNRLFPDHEDIRHAAAHRAEFARDAERHAAKAASIPGIESDSDQVRVMTSGTLHNRTYVTTVDGCALKFEMSLETSEALRAVTAKVWDALEPAFAALRAVPEGGTLKPKVRPGRGCAD